MKHAILTILLTFTIFPVLAHSDSLQGLVTRYSTDCPETKRAELSLKFQTMETDVKEAVSRMDSLLEEIEKQLSENHNVAYTIQSSQVRIDQVSRSTQQRQGNFDQFPPQDSGYTQNLWRVSGSFILHLDEADGAKTAFVALSDSGFIPSLSIQTSRPDKCKTE